MASIKTLCKATGWLDLPLKSVPTKWFGRLALPLAGEQLGEDARRCADIDWCGERCATAVGVTRGVVHKVAIVVSSQRHDLLAIVTEIIECHLGDHPTTAVDGMLIFDGDDGNVMVQEIAGASPAQVVVYVTSLQPKTLGAEPPAQK